MAAMWVWFSDAQDLGFALEALELIPVVREVVRQDLDGDVASKLGVTRPVDFAHSAAAERRQNLVGTKPRARKEGHCSFKTSTESPVHGL